MRRIFLAVALGLVGSLHAATYYVDFAAGSDTNNGTSTATPWKHCPGDANAATGAGKPGSTNLAAGDRVNFKGGVVYRGKILLTWSGSSGANQDIKFEGDAAVHSWGTGKATIDGTDPIATAWTQCTSAEDCHGNANWANIWHTAIPGGMADPLHTPLLWNNATWIRCASNPVPTVAAEWMYHPQVWTISSPAITNTTITDATHLVSADSHYYDGGWVGVWVSPNEDTPYPITAYDPATHKITFTNTVDSVYTDQPDYYAIFGLVQDISAAGMWTTNVTDNRLYLWAPGSVDPNGGTVSWGNRGCGFLFATQDYLTFDGLIFQGQMQATGTPGDSAGFAIDGAGSSPCNHLAYNNCESRFIISMDKGQHSATFQMKASGGTGFTITNCLIHDNLGNEGLLIMGSNALASGNELYHVGTGIYFTGVTTGTISGNYSHDCNGAHGNAISVYGSSDGVTISGNRAINCGSPITYERSANLTFVNNLVDSGGNDWAINCWGGMSGTIVWAGNTLTNWSGASGAGIWRAANDGSTANYVMLDNIICGGGPVAGATTSGTVTHTYNIYTAYATSWGQDDSYLSTGETHNTSLTSIFTSPSTGDWTLKTGSPAIRAGADMSAYSLVDLAGVSRGTIPDIGAYQFGAGITITPAHARPGSGAVIIA